ncbi:unnamed protein product [Larinioides sclopetarius]|uniref:Thioredoxin domain-containing protein n=2 Tax=Larinioides sclopetarius TaxID=280406 RepID=A0AAV1Z2L8_9ARAC
MSKYFEVRVVQHYIYIVTSFLFLLAQAESNKKDRNLSVYLTDEKYQQTQNGQWLIGFFDKETKESLQLEKEWESLALKSQDQGIKFGQVFGPQNPALCVRFLVTSYPRVFYISNGIVHVVKQPTQEALVKLIESKKWHEPKKINFLYDPFSFQMSLLSNMFVHAANLYNYEDSIVKKFVPFSSATDVFFGLTFIVVGTFLGLLITIMFGAFQVFFMSSKSSEDSHRSKKRHSSHSSSDSSSESASSEEETIRAPRKERSVRKRK